MYIYTCDVYVYITNPPDEAVALTYFPILPVQRALKASAESAALLEAIRPTTYAIRAAIEVGIHESEIGDV